MPEIISLNLKILQSDPGHLHGIGPYLYFLYMTMKDYKYM